MFQVTVVVSGPSPTATGFGDAEIVAADACGLAEGAVASGAFDRIASGGKEQCQENGNGNELFIKLIYFSSFPNWDLQILSLKRQARSDARINHLLLHKP